MIEVIKQEITGFLHAVGVEGEIELSQPPKPEMGDLAFGCFALAKEKGENPAAVAKALAAELKAEGFVERVEAFGPYVNFFINSEVLANALFGEITHDSGYGEHTLPSAKTVMVEFAHPNTHKMFHIGHLRNIITGESVVRMLENAGYAVVRANYQGDVGMHIAKSLWGIQELMDEYQVVQEQDLHARVAFLGKAYATGGQAFEKDEAAKEAIIEMNKKIYAKDASISAMYEMTRGWSLEYFDFIYGRVGSHFDRLYFESEVYERCEQIVREFLKKGVFEESEGAIIFPGSKHGVHDRVFITSQGFPGYEAKEMALGELQFGEYHPEEVIHVVGKEQTGYFQVVIKALEHTLPESAGKERHLVYGWVHLKEGKMSSRTGQVVLGEDLLDSVKERILSVMDESDLPNKDDVAEAVTMAAVKYAFLRTGVDNDIAFDMEESVSTTGNSGPYLLYIVARIKSIIEKADGEAASSEAPADIAPEEKRLLWQLAMYPEVTKSAVELYDPSRIAKYLFDLAQAFNSFYAACPVLQSEGAQRAFRLRLLAAVEQVMSHGLGILGIDTVEKM